MKDTTSVSVIIPVYKAEQYIHHCLDSMLAQTFKDFEIILIDDGSPDKSGEICDSYAAADNRIKVIHKKNGGVSSARQCGIDHAVGEYTIHVDPDDWTEPDMLEALYSAAVAKNADIAVCDYFEDYHGKSRYRKLHVPDNPDSCIRMLLDETLHSACWNKLIRRRLYTDYNIRFPQDMSMWEDMATIPRLFAHAGTVTYVPKALYHYTRDINPNAITKDITFGNCLTREKAVGILQDAFRGDPRLSEDLLYLKLKIRTALLQCCTNSSQLKEAMLHYPEANAVLYSHPTISSYSKTVTWLCSHDMASSAMLMLKIRNVFKTLKNN